MWSHLPHNVITHYFRNGCKSDVITENTTKKSNNSDHTKDVVHVAFSRNKS